MKKTKIAVISIIVVLIVVISITALVILNKPNKFAPEDIFKEYISNINNQDYEAMYEMLSDESKSSISKEDFTKRNKNIYEGIDMKNLNIDIEFIEEDTSTTKITYNSKMDSSAGEISFSNKVELTKNKEKGYVINWDSNLIFPNLDNDDKVRIKETTPKRGELQDRNGVILAGNDTVSSVGIVPGKLGDNKDEKIENIANLLEITVELINNNLSASWVKEDSFVPIKKVSKDNTDLKEKLLQIPGVKITTAESRAYPLGEEAAHLTGYVQNITAEELEKNADKGYTDNSVIGKAGLEKVYEDRLRGKSGIEIYIEDSNRNKKTTIKQIEVQDGENIKLNIDYNLQKEIYTELKDDKGFFVVMNPYTGEVLALVSTPSYDVNDFVLGISTQKWNNLKNDENTPMLTRYLQTYCPGSTFKPITGAIGLFTNSVNINDEFNYSGLSWKKDASWGNYNITTLTAYSGAKNLKNAIIHSDNIYFAQLALKIGKNNFTNMLNKIKFNENIDFELNTSKSQYSNNNSLDLETLLADSGYGQGQILVNPIHMASIYSAFTNNGNMVKPYLEYREEKTTEYLAEEAFTKEVSDTIKDYLLEVVENPEGTATDMKIQGKTIAGKTGTAELKSAKGEQGETLGWFNCFTLNESKEDSLLIISMVEDASQNGGSHYLIKKIRNIINK